MLKINKEDTYSSHVYVSGEFNGEKFEFSHLFEDESFSFGKHRFVDDELVALIAQWKKHYFYGY
jgi:hypothetical protein